MAKLYKQNCKQCGEYYERLGAKLFCSLDCANINIDRINKIKEKIPKGRQTNTGKTHFKKGQNQNENAHNWKGDDVGISPLHLWVIRRLGKPTKCEFCGKEGLLGKKIHWANKSHQYKRDLSDWLRLCVSCHFKYDKITEKRKRNELGQFIQTYV